MVQFRPLNLVQELSHLGFFDVVFCRNVLIYFDQDTKTKVLGNIARAMRPDGYLVLGAAETVVGLTDAFEPGAGSAWPLRADIDGEAHLCRAGPQVAASSARAFALSGTSAI